MSWVGGTQPSRIVLLSEGIGHSKRARALGGHPARPTGGVSDSSAIQPHLCGLVALLNDQPHRITDIDAVLKLDEGNPDSLKRKLLQVRPRLWA